ncbi:RICIN domain-containing protein [Nonomuraea spiralis]|uniref:RICIN domain-containing protein n=1 Tax=Nonomuraea spiralis TaxID=46182 RepID=A0ABV5IW27_9ACTN|nr:RICIN domain-containing protein [Nonomuraea spiralis]GGS84874.1 hypothetical protein GCM10010176_030750 [Nonomuraea spiralis]
MLALRERGERAPVPGGGQEPGPKWRGTGFPFELVARHSGKCLDVQDAGRAHGAHVLQATCSDPSHPRPNQVWRMRTP